MSAAAERPSRIMEILERETGGHSYKSHKYSLDESERTPLEYGEAGSSIQWQRRGGKPRRSKPMSRWRN